MGRTVTFSDRTPGLDGGAEKEPPPPMANTKNAVKKRAWRRKTKENARTKEANAKGGTGDVDLEPNSKTALRGTASEVGRRAASSSLRPQDSSLGTPEDMAVLEMVGMGGARSQDGWVDEVRMRISSVE
ncbi:unnamed protein product [Choristocarpus tenellus]